MRIKNRPAEKSASQAAAKDYAECFKLMERIQKTIEGRGRATNWAEAGDAAHLRERLQELSDMVHHEGEYAE